MDGIQPLFSENCTTCHGPDKQKAGLNLTDKKSARAELKSGKRAVVPGNPDGSELIYRVTTDDADDLMPPPDHGKRLKPAQIALIRQWITEGGRWSQHWAYLPLSQVAPPEVKTGAWIRNEIDRFVLAKLEATKLQPSPHADRNTLIKRLSYDLIGLPPTPGEVEAFVNDKSSEAYNKLVGRLLASQHFGERWGRHWLDVARYGEDVRPKGFQTRPLPHAYKYRDWVIQAFNRDMPYDRFVTETMGGDELGHGESELLVAD